MPIQFPRGARPSPANIAFAVPSFQPLAAVPDSYTPIPDRLSPWGNTTYGCCVSSEEAAAKALYSVACGLPETFIPEATLISWARQRGFLNGAVIVDVMDAMAKYGIVAADGKIYRDGPYHSVDWTTDAVLSAAIYQGPVKIGVAADQLEGAMNSALTSGWVASGFHRDTSIDHCVNLCGFGTMAQLCSALKTPLPSGVSPSARGYLLFTWGTIGVIDQPSMIAITGEAWLRTPTTVGQAPQPHPAPAPTPAPVPTPTTWAPPTIVSVQGPDKSIWTAPTPTWTQAKP